MNYMGLIIHKKTLTNEGFIYFNFTLYETKGKS